MSDNMLQARREGDRLVVSFAGKIDTSNALSVEAELRALIAAVPEDAHLMHGD